MKNKQEDATQASDINGRVDVFGNKERVPDEELLKQLFELNDYEEESKIPDDLRPYEKTVFKELFQTSNFYVVDDISAVTTPERVEHYEDVIISIKTVPDSKDKIYDVQFEYSYRDNEIIVHHLYIDIEFCIVTGSKKELTMEQLDQIEWFSPISQLADLEEQLLDDGII